MVKANPYSTAELVKKLKGHYPTAVKFSHDMRTCDLCRWGATIEKLADDAANDMLKAAKAQREACADNVPDDVERKVLDTPLVVHDPSDDFSFMP